MSERPFFIVENNAPVPTPLTREQVQVKIDAGWDDYILQQGASPPWQRFAAYNFKKSAPQAAPPPPPPPAPAPTPPPPPVLAAPPRFFYAWINNAAGPRMTEAETRALLASGYSGYVILEGEQTWQLPAHYKLDAAPPAPPVAAAATPVATTPAATVAAPAVQQTLFPVATGPTVLAQLKEFSKKPGCEDYKNDGDRIKLLILYLWMRQISGISFATFLDGFAPQADFSEDNRKHPEDALSFHCPRNAKVATARAVKQWSAKETADFAALYIEYLRGCEANSTPAQSFDEFLGANAAAYLGGSLKHPEIPAEAKKGGGKGSFNQTAVVRPTAAGQRVIYTMGSGRQLRGITEGSIVVDDGREYLDFKADGGEFFQNVTLEHLTCVDAPAEQLPPDANGHPKGVLEEQNLWLPKNAVFNVRQALDLPIAMGNVNLGDVIYPYSCGFGRNLEALVEIVNGETGPFVDARLIDTISQQTVCSLPPRKHIEGDYPFEAADGVFMLRVKVRE